MNEKKEAFENIFYKFKPKNFMCDFKLSQGANYSKSFCKMQYSLLLFSLQPKYLEKHEKI